MVVLDILGVYLIVIGVVLLIIGIGLILDARKELKKSTDTKESKDNKSTD